MMFKAKVGSQLGFSFLVILAEIIYSESNSVGSGYALKKAVRIRTVTMGIIRYLIDSTYHLSLALKSKTQK